MALSQELQAKLQAQWDWEDAALARGWKKGLARVLRGGNESLYYKDFQLTPNSSLQLLRLGGGLGRVWFSVPFGRDSVNFDTEEGAEVEIAKWRKYPQDIARWRLSLKGNYTFGPLLIWKDKEGNWKTRVGENWGEGKYKSPQEALDNL